MQRLLSRAARSSEQAQRTAAQQVEPQVAVMAVKGVRLLLADFWRGKISESAGQGLEH